MSKPVLVVAALAGFLLLAPLSASAQTFRGFNTQNFRVPTDPHGYVTMDGARTLRALQPHVSVGINWAHNPLTFTTASDDLIQDFTNLDVAIGLGLFEFGEAGGLSIGVHLPVIVDLHGERFDDADRSLPSGGLNDWTLNAKATLFDREEDLIGLFFRMAAIIPTGHDRESNFTSNKDKISLDWTLGVEKQFESIFRIGIEVGYQWIDSDIKVGGQQVDDKLRLNAGAGLSIGTLMDTEALEDLWLIFEATSTGRIGHLYEDSTESPVEIGGGLKYTGLFYCQVGATAGVNRGVGAPDVRVYAQVGFTLPN